MSALFPNLSCRLDSVECMDRPDCDPVKLSLTLAAFRWTNRLYARYRTILQRWIITDMERAPQCHYHIADVGAGGGDIAAWLARRCRALGLRVTMHALDADPRAIAFARERYGTVAGLEFREQNVLEAGGLAGMDYVFGNHVLHHLRDEQIAGLLRSLAGSPVRRFLFSDLLRRYHAYYGHSVVGAFFPGTFIGVDGRLSLRRGFTVAEMQQLLHTAGVAEFTHLYRLYPARIVVVGDFRQKYK